jgi:2-keto-4-pentenoate hydratase/2-oxohepta-3-ene-1,7-dioic acid hydratase in catechol pathway
MSAGFVRSYDPLMDLVRTQTGVGIRDSTGQPAPVPMIIGIGLNYAGHAREQGQGLPERPVVFSKNLMAASIHGDPIRVPRVCQDRPQVDFEGELAVVIGQPARDVPRDDALSFVLGYTCANDVSARWWQKQGSGGQFFRGKSFDSFCPLGPRVAPTADVGDPQKLRLTTRVNGRVMQDSTTADMIFDVATLVSELSRGTTLLPGTVILTGTPSGVGMARTPPAFLAPGDEVEVDIERIGILRNRVEFE